MYSFYLISNDNCSKTSVKGNYFARIITNDSNSVKLNTLRTYFNSWNWKEWKRIQNLEYWLVFNGQWNQHLVHSWISFALIYAEMVNTTTLHLFATTKSIIFFHSELQLRYLYQIKYKLSFFSLHLPKQKIWLRLFSFSYQILLLKRFFKGLVYMPRKRFLLWQ